MDDGYDWKGTKKSRFRLEDDDARGLGTEPEDEGQSISLSNSHV